jgi:DNA-binding CsgD family transcriptional regulator/PAS domain-containing protein
MDESHRLADLVAQMYEAAIDGAQWPDVWSSLTRTLGATSAVFYVQDTLTKQTQMLGMPGVSDAAGALYAAHYHAVDPFVAFGQGLRSKAILLGQEIIDQSAFERSELWNDYSRTHVGAYHFLCASIPIHGRETLSLGVHRPKEAAAYEESDRRQADWLLGHAQRSLQLRARFDAQRIVQASQTEILEQIGFGALVLSEAGHVIYANSAAEHLCLGAGLRLGRTVLGIQTPVNVGNERLRTLIARTAAGGIGGALRISRDGAKPLIVSVSRLPDALARRHSLIVAPKPLHLVLVMIRDVTAAGVLPSALADLFSLTRSEAEVATALASGLTAQRVALQRGVSLFTVRAQIRQILAKVGADNLRDLTQILGQISINRPPDR